jgi:hypothetical protein
MTRHLLIAGHGRRPNGSFDPGATGLISKGEHRYMSEDLFPAIKKFLPADHDVILFDDYNVFAHGNIVDLAKRFNADEVTEFHFDAASAAASGGHVIVYSGYAPDDVDLALRDVIEDMVGIRYEHRGHRGISGRSDLANVNRTANAGITYRLLELGFGTNKEDARIMTENVEEYAKKLVEVFAGSTADKQPKKTAPAPKQQTKSSGSSSKQPDMQTNSIVDYLISIDEDHSFANRKRLADQYGISNYRGTESQNLELLNKLRSGSAPVSKPSSSNVTSYTGDSIVDFLNLKGNEHLGGSGFNNRKRLAAQHGISKYTGTAAQNTRLLNALRGSSGGSTNRNVTSYTGDSIVDYLNLPGNKHLGGSSFSNRKRLAEQHGISNYRGTAAQNRQLLNILRR